MGGCTTYVAMVLIDKLLGEDYCIIGYPRLVRLNPNIPWKTRGNGSVCLQVGRNGDKKSIIGEINSRRIYSYSKKSYKNLEEEDFIYVEEILKDIIKENAMLENDNTNPGFVLLKNQPSVKIYEKSVRGIVFLDEIKRYLDVLGAFYHGYKNCRGLIGATASVAWSGNSDTTYELITYREKKRWGTDRIVNNDSVKDMDKKCLSTFDNYDYLNNHNRLVPSSPCPVLYGIRGTRVKDLLKAYDIVKSEKRFGWLLFETNQGTDDHLKKKSINQIRQYESVIAEGCICRTPYTIQGGHTIFSIKDSTGKIDCAAYEPTKQFRNIVRELMIGDIVQVYGGVRERPLTVNIEKIKIKSLVKHVVKIENPVCSKCGKHMKSKGKNQGYKCKNCGLISANPVVEEKKRMIKTGFYETPVCARRHLSKPLKRF
jgi:tRNA(Ile2)-agmatinylcytidine synthase